MRKNLTYSSGSVVCSSRFVAYSSDFVAVDRAAQELRYAELAEQHAVPGHGVHTRPDYLDA